MSKIAFSNTYKLKDNASAPDFLIAIEKLVKEHVSKQNGYVSFQLLANDDIWTDSVIFETMADLNAFLESSHNNKNELADKFYSFLNFATCKSTTYTVVQSY
ncbi:MAG: hypothetical protein FWE01_01700 [Firmicutes bacterium]|nr:hypothetical protein [Bacillota bacterium]